MEVFSDARAEIVKELGEVKGIASFVHNIYRVFGALDILDSVISGTYKELRLSTGAVVLKVPTVKSCVVAALTTLIWIDEVEI